MGNEIAKPKLVEKFSDRYHVDPSKMLNTLKATAFKQKDGKEPSNEQMMALLVVADQYGLNPFTKEIYAFPDKQNGIIPVVGLDGWSRIINTDEEFDGMEFNYSEDMIQPEGSKNTCFEWIECVMYRKDRSHPVKVREYLDEVYRPPFKGSKNGSSYTVNGPWQTHTKRMLRHKATIQCARLAFGFVGIYDQDEAERIMEGNMVDVTPPSRKQEAIKGKSSRLGSIVGKKQEKPVDLDPEDTDSGAESEEYDGQQETGAQSAGVSNNGRTGNQMEGDAAGHL